MARGTVIEGIRQGQISMNQWVWSPSDNDWKLIAELHELHVSPTPSPDFKNEPIAWRPLKLGRNVPIEKLTKIQHSTDAFQVDVATRHSQPREVKEENPVLTVLCFILFLALVSVLAVKYFMV
jgi:hypothetical protein